MRSVLFRFPDLHAFERLMGAAGAGDLELTLPENDPVEDGEWLLAVFELGEHRRATSAAARASVSPESSRVVLEARDRRRLSEFASLEASRPVQNGEPAPAKGLVAAPDGEPPSTERSLTNVPAEPPRRPSFAPAALPSVAPRAPMPSGAGARVLVVDDDADIRDMVSAMLEAVELRVTAAGSAEDALALLRSEVFELVVLDWNLPRMTGIELCRTLRQRQALATLPVLFLTANASSQDMVEAFAAGADDYVVKPFRAPELGARIFSLLRRARIGNGSV